MNYEKIKLQLIDFANSQEFFAPINVPARSKLAKIIKRLLVEVDIPLEVKDSINITTVYSDGSYRFANNIYKYFQNNWSNKEKVINYLNNKLS